MSDTLQFFGWVVLLLIAFGGGYLAGNGHAEDVPPQIITLNQTNTIETKLQAINYNFNNTVTYNNTLVNLSTRTIYMNSNSDFWNTILVNSADKEYFTGTYDSVNLTNKNYDALVKMGYSVDRFSTYYDKEYKFRALLGAYVFIEPVTGDIIPPKSYPTYGINNGRIKQYDGKTNDYNDNKAMNKTYIKICGGYS